MSVAMMKFESLNILDKLIKPQLSDCLLEVLQPSQPNGVMSSPVSLPKHLYWAGLDL